MRTMYLYRVTYYVIRCQFLWAKNLVQQHSFPFRALHTKIKRHPDGCPFLYNDMKRLWMVLLISISGAIFHICSQSYGLRSDTKGLSHGLKKCPPDTFLPPAGRAVLSSPGFIHQIKKTSLRMSFLFGGRGGTWTRTSAVNTRTWI